jgi:cobaltochelatase CobN
MHLLAAKPGVVDDGGDAVDLGQTPGDIIVLSAADTELAMLAKAQAKQADDAPELRLASLLHLGHNLSVDTYVDDIVARAKLVVVRLLGGAGYWPYGVERVAETCRAKGIALAILPGDDQPDPELAGISTLPAEACHRLWQYCVQGGPDNAAEFLNYAATLIGGDGAWREPAPLMRAGLYWPGQGATDFKSVAKMWTNDGGVTALVFYRALYQAANLAPVDALITALQTQGLRPLPLFVSSLKDPLAVAILESVFADAPPCVVLNATGFAVGKPGAAHTAGPLDAPGAPVLQVVFAGSDVDSWRAGTRGLSARDIAMNVALPEIDGRILSRAVSFKAEARYDAATQSSIVAYAPVPDRIDFVAQMAAGWARLGAAPAPTRRIALVMANYPNRDGRMGNGVGLDSPAAAAGMLQALAAAGYRVENPPLDGNALIERLQQGPTNAHDDMRQASESLTLADYASFFAGLPRGLQDQVTAKWGAPESDPFFRDGEVDCGSFAIPAYRVGNVCVALQPARGYNIDPVKTYHDPDLVPPHGYLAFYAWLRHGFAAHAVIHVGKHGNLEWLPGKALALSASCLPEAALGPLPHLYPFIVNDPGEGTQAKRRSAAVIIDHLTPPLARAETYGPLRDLEARCDEYYEAASVDPRRLRLLGKQILETAAVLGLDVDVGIAEIDDEATALSKLDNYLCELKEMQIRDGLHIFGRSPEEGLLDALLAALVRVPRGTAPGDASMLRALAGDLGFDGFDPLDCEMGAAWDGVRPAALGALSDESWRSAGDTVERLELLILELLSGRAQAEAGWTATAAVLDFVEQTLRPAVAASGPAEMAGLLRGLEARFVEPGPSGAPTRGRPDVLPTGRNFYSVDTRAVPTPAAWQLGWKSAELLVEHHRQTHGAWPRAMAISAWGTSNMRTGGDDIAQTLALMGVRPTWEGASGRVTGFEIIPADMLDRPRVDVTLRISGFFRDAFPGLIDLVDSAARAVADLDEPDDFNPLAQRVRADAAEMIADGVDEASARKRAGHRVFGSKPGAYGAGLQALLDEKGWRDEADLARAYVAWGGYAYGAGSEGRPEHGLFERRLGAVEAVVQNQDNREHDLLDSDDYYQFEGGLAVAVRVQSGRQPAIYHNDHSRPETPRIRTLEDEIGRVVRARVVNPKWIKGVMRHGYKGAFEMAATVDYMFAFAATAHAVKDHHFDAVFEAYLGDAEVRDFIADNNPQALREIAEKLLEAQARQLWRPRLNSTHAILTALAQSQEAT